MTHDKVLSMLSLAHKAGKLKSGEFAVEKAAKSKQAQLVIVAKDASAGTKKSYKDLCSHYHAVYTEYGDKAALGQAIGKEFRAALAVCDENFAKEITGRMHRALEKDKAPKNKEQER